MPTHQPLPETIDAPSFATGRIDKLAENAVDAFLTWGGAATLAYLQSYGMVEYLARSYGEGSISQSSSPRWMYRKSALR